MIFHLSIEADDAQRTAEVLAEIWGGKAMPFPFVGNGSWLAFSGADDGTLVEVYRRGTMMGIGEVEATGFEKAPRRESATHFAMSTDLTAEQVHAIAEREGWPVRTCQRGDGIFGVIEVWIDGCNLVEVLTPEMQRQYLDSVTIANWQAGLAQFAEAQKLAA